MNKVEVLILSSTIDYSTDLVCYQLEKKNIRYLRLNRDQFSDYQILFDLKDSVLRVNVDGTVYEISNNCLKAVYFRAPVYLRTGKQMTIDEQLSKEQWNAFLRNLIIFDKARWINNPVSTYRAENKLLQLEIAKKVGMTVPKTFVGNILPRDISESLYYIVKSLDTALLYEGNNELFAYSNTISGSELLSAEISTAPIILQELIEDKIDLRVTVVGEKIFPASILAHGKGIHGDWRRMGKEDLQYLPVNLPYELESKIVDFMRKMCLDFAGIDFALSNGKYYFIESNPTGEWGWLTKTTGFSIDLEIANALVSR